MSFNFGSFGQTTGPPASAPPSTTATPAPSFSFATPAQPAGQAGTNTPAAPGTPAGPPPASTNTSFSFGSFGANANASKPATLSFGTPASGQPANPFGSTQPAAQPKPSFSFGAPSTGTTGSPFGQPAASTSTASTATAPAPAPTFAGFGQPAKPSTPAASTTNASPFSFAAPPPATSASITAPAKPAVPSFGAPAAGGSSFSFGTPASTPPVTASTDQAKPAPASTGFSFGAPPKPAEDKAAAPAVPTFGFGKPPATSTPAAAPSSGSGGFSFGAPASTTSTSASTPAPTPAAKTPALPTFGAPPASTSASTTAASARAAAPAPAPATGGFSFGTPAPAANATSALGSAPAKPLEASKPAAVPSLLAGMRLEEIVNRWYAELDERTREFSHLAGEVRAWDSVLVQNGENISRLYTALLATEPTQASIDQSLDYVETQQKELSSILDSYEQNVTEILGEPRAGQSDNEREKAYALAETLNTQLDDMSKTLSSLIGEVNSLSHRSGITPGPSDDPNKPADPVSQITAILNAHLSSLQSIESQTEGLRKQVDDLEWRIKGVSQSDWKGLESGSQRGTPRAQRVLGPASRTNSPVVRSNLYR
ncbi:uncharacterized protein L969DRAFT_91651 [Mixia osmundae IAM 14324]|uniref:Nucleoporin NSP1 n=1 Tax=Mixia osmundae (strain CBS 9802 / IAM 14324 / JCM 22182 / KY 12970) TaxID=764103 RepID=G7E036_MIXOS|nr:uncharacterized protein L969DRAFT_91651 [Mixia osmundae IAM 14324]KEI42188.1 hypothetical protein L969DRAFT_91651 [Mixia osmundae IAM 14324]GAA96196.1 hypothetical protein E5Q_02860 [Mixia osmundae IAM 14324]